MARDWPVYQRGTVEDLDTHLTNFDDEVDGAQYQVQVTPFGADPVAGAWVAYPYRVNGLAVGLWDLWTLWSTAGGAEVLNHVGPDGMPSFEVI